MAMALAAVAHFPHSICSAIIYQDGNESYCFCEFSQCRLYELGVRCQLDRQGQLLSKNTNDYLLKICKHQLQ